MNDLQVYKNNEIRQQEAMRAELFNRFIAYLDASPKTVETYTKSIKQFIQYLAENGINNPTRVDVINYKESLKDRGLKPTTITNYIAVTKIFFKWTAQEGLYPNIAEHIKGGKISREHKKDYLTSRQTKEILKKADKETVQGIRNYAMFVLTVTGGLRTIELKRANVGDLRTVGDFTVLYIQGKGREEKTDYIKIAPEVEKAIRQYLKTRENISEEQPLFTSLSNNSKGDRLTTRAISGAIKEMMKNAGYNSERLTAHSLRHTAVTLSLLAGKDITEVQQFARHANISTTMIYNHSLDKAKNSCSDAITKAIF